MDETECGEDWTEDSDCANGADSSMITGGRDGGAVWGREMEMVDMDTEDSKTAGWVELSMSTRRGVGVASAAERRRRAGVAGRGGRVDWMVAGAVVTVEVTGR